VADAIETNEALLLSSEGLYATPLTTRSDWRVMAAV
jgi:hypothetical protein